MTNCKIVTLLIRDKNHGVQERSKRRNNIHTMAVTLSYDYNLSKRPSLEGLE